MGRIEQVRKRDGSLDRYDESKLERSILRAAREAGRESEPLARGLAEVVTTFLRNHFAKRGAPTSEEIREMVRKALVETGYAEVAETYHRFRKPDRPEPSSDLFPQDLILVTGGTRDEAARWHRDRIVEALVREADLDPATASRVAARVEEKILALKTPRLSTSLIRELVNHELMEEGRPVPLERQRVVGVPKADLRAMLAAPEALDPDALCASLGEMTLRQFALQEIFAPDVADAHQQGRIHIHNLENPLKMHAACFRAEDVGAGPESLPDLRLYRFRSAFAEVVEIRAPRLHPLAALLPDLARAWAGRTAPAIVLGGVVESAEELADFLRLVDQAAPAPVRVDVVSGRRGGADPVRPLAQRAVHRGGAVFTFSDEPERLGATVQAVSVNLPQALARAGGRDRLFREIAEAVELAVLAHQQRSRSGLAGDRSGRHAIAVQGLADLARRVLGRPLGSDEPSLLWGLQILGGVQGLVREAALRTGLDLTLDDLVSLPAVERLARIDARLFATSGAAAAYVPGAHLPPEISVRDRLEGEARLGALMRGGSVVIPREARPGLTTEELLRLLQDAARDGRVRRLAVP